MDVAVPAGKFWYRGNRNALAALFRSRHHRLTVCRATLAALTRGVGFARAMKAGLAELIEN
jgi:hypothetical protein